MNTLALRVLELPEVLSLLAGRAATAPGAERVRTLAPTTDGEWIDRELVRVSAMRAVSAGNDGLSAQSFFPRTLRLQLRPERKFVKRTTQQRAPVSYPHDELPSGPPLRRPRVTSSARVHARSRAHARPRHRCQRRDVRHRRCAPLPITVRRKGSRSRRWRVNADRRSAERAGRRSPRFFPIATNINLRDNARGFAGVEERLRRADRAVVPSRAVRLSPGIAAVVSLGVPELFRPGHSRIGTPRSHPRAP